MLRSSSPLVLAIGLAVGATGASGCGAEPEPAFGDPSGIVGKKLKEKAGGGSSSSSGGDGGAEPDGYFPATDPPAPTTTAEAAHAAGAAKGAPAISATLECLSAGCHGGGGTAPAFAYGGYVVKSGAPAAGAIIAVKTSSGFLASKSDPKGYFWFKGPRVTEGSVAAKPEGATAPQQEKLMGGDLLPSNDNGNCNSGKCHNGGTSPVFVP